jgi:pimeloyl-ACP methyl ester carboxylesterase
MEMKFHMRNIFTLYFILINALMAGCASMGAINIPVEQLKKQYTSNIDKYMDFYGVQVRYRDEGRGPVLLLLHGICASLETWNGWVNQMKGNYRIIRLDIPGFGITGPAPNKSYYNREMAVEFLDAFMARLGINNFNMAGNSLGGYLAWNYALKYPHKVRRLILIDSVGYKQKLPFILDFATSPAMQVMARSMMPRWMLNKAVYQVYGDKSKVTPEAQKRYFDFAMREGNKGSYVDIFLEMRRQNESVNISKDIPNIKVPTLVMWGTKDEWVPFMYFEKWKKDLPSARFISYEGAGHIPMEEIPDITARDAMSFLMP